MLATGRQNTLDVVGGAKELKEAFDKSRVRGKNRSYYTIMARDSREAIRKHAKNGPWAGHDIFGPERRKQNKEAAADDKHQVRGKR